MSDSSYGVRPTDYTDVGNADLFQVQYKGLLIYVDALGWLNWNGKVWERGDHMAAQRAVELTDEMLFEAAGELHSALHAEAEAKSDFIQHKEGDKALLEEAQKAVHRAKNFYMWANRSRGASRLKAMMELASHYMVVKAEELDTNPFLLNTPAGEVDLHTGELKEHGIDSPFHYCTRITAVAPCPTPEGTTMWYKFLETVTCGDSALAGFVQQVAGMALIGKVFHEGLIIAHGGGRNGKSTLFNALATVLGDYAGSIDPKVLTTDRQNKGAALATLRGKRLVLAAELEEHQRLSTSTLKQLASTDRLTIEEKYRAPETVEQTHTLILFTNFLPRIGSTDNGTWRRILVIPFNAVIPPDTGVQNYADVLVDQAGGTILHWAVQGAVDFIKNGCKLVVPDAVAVATEEYQTRENWLERFIADKCARDPNSRVGARELYEEYRTWAQETGDFIRREVDFAAEMEKSGFKKITPKNRKTWLGLHLNLSERSGYTYAATG